jgi:hypothetical protein
MKTWQGGYVGERIEKRNSPGMNFSKAQLLNVRQGRINEKTNQKSKENVS